MTTLHPTKTRLALLQAVADGDVIEGLTDTTIGDSWWTSEFVELDPPRKVTARMDELDRAGWVELGPDAVLWQLTDAGRAVLDGRQG